MSSRGRLVALTLTNTLRTYPKRFARPSTIGKSHGSVVRSVPVSRWQVKVWEPESELVHRQMAPRNRLLVLTYSKNVAIPLAAKTDSQSNSRRFNNITVIGQTAL